MDFPDHCPLKGLMIRNCLKDCEHARRCLELNSPADTLLEAYLTKMGFDDGFEQLIEMFDRGGSQVQVLLAFDQRPEWTTNELAEVRGIDGNLALKALKALEQRGLVYRVDHERRGRKRTSRKTTWYLTTK